MFICRARYLNDLFGFLSILSEMSKSLSFVNTLGLSLLSASHGTRFTKLIYQITNSILMRYFLFWNLFNKFSLHFPCEVSTFSKTFSTKNICCCINIFKLIAHFQLRRDSPALIDCICYYTFVSKGEIILDWRIERNAGDCYCCGSKFLYKRITSLYYYQPSQVTHWLASLRSDLNITLYLARAWNLIKLQRMIVFSRI